MGRFGSSLGQLQIIRNSKCVDVDNCQQFNSEEVIKIKSLLKSKCPDTITCPDNSSININGEDCNPVCEYNPFAIDIFKLKDSDDINIDADDCDSPYFLTFMKTGNNYNIRIDKNDNLIVCKKGLFTIESSIVFSIAKTSQDFDLNMMLYKIDSDSNKNPIPNTLTTTRCRRSCNSEEQQFNLKLSTQIMLDNTVICIGIWISDLSYNIPNVKITPCININNEVSCLKFNILKEGDDSCKNAGSTQLIISSFSVSNTNLSIENSTIINKVYFKFIEDNNYYGNIKIKNDNLMVYKNGFYFIDCSIIFLIDSPTQDFDLNMMLCTKNSDGVDVPMLDTLTTIRCKKNKCKNNNTFNLNLLTQQILDCNTILTMGIWINNHAFNTICEDIPNPSFKIDYINSKLNFRLFTTDPNLYYPGYIYQSQIPVGETQPQIIEKTQSQESNLGEEIIKSLITYVKSQEKFIEEVCVGKQGEQGGQGVQGCQGVQGGQGVQGDCGKDGLDSVNTKSTLFVSNELTPDLTEEEICYIAWKSEIYNNVDFLEHNVYGTECISIDNVDGMLGNKIVKQKYCTLEQAHTILETTIGYCGYSYYSKNKLMDGSYIKCCFYEKYLQAAYISDDNKEWSSYIKTYSDTSKHLYIQESGYYHINYKSSFSCKQGEELFEILYGIYNKSYEYTLIKNTLNRAMNVAYVGEVYTISSCDYIYLEKGSCINIGISARNIPSNVSKTNIMLKHLGSTLYITKP